MLNINLPLFEYTTVSFTNKTQVKVIKKSLWSVFAICSTPSNKLYIVSSKQYRFDDAIPIIAKMFSLIKKKVGKIITNLH